MHPTLILAMSLGTAAIAGPITYAACQAGCAPSAMACYAAAGFTWGATLGITAPATVLSCNLALGKCYAACAAIALLPFTP